MTSVRIADLNEWTLKEIGQSVQSQRRKIKKIITDLATEVGRKFSGIIERAVA